jgi:hypothetical protein
MASVAARRAMGIARRRAVTSLCPDNNARFSEKSALYRLFVVALRQSPVIIFVLHLHYACLGGCLVLGHFYSSKRLISGLSVLGLSSFCFVSGAGASLATDLELFYNFDNDTIGADGIFDQSGNARTGSPRDNDGLSLSTDFATATGSGGSLANDGGDLLLADWNGIGGIQDRTIAMWVKTTAVGSGSVLAEWGANNNGERFTFRFENSGSQTGPSQIGGLRTEIQGDYRTTSGPGPTANSGTWRHVATVFDYTTGTALLEQVTMYVDGVAIASYNDNANLQAINTAVSNQVRIAGGDLTGSARNVIGNVDEVGIWSRALSASEVGELAGGASFNLIAGTNFDDTVKSGASQVMTGIDWSEHALVTANTSVTTLGNNDAGYFDTGFGATGFAPDQNIENEGPWIATFEITLDPGATGTLETVAFDYAGLTNTGTGQTGNRDQNFDVFVNGVSFDTQKQTSQVNGSLDFTDLADLNEGLNTIVIVSTEVDGPGYNMGIDNLRFFGEVVPEPSSLALIGLGGLLMVLRRRC